MALRANWRGFLKVAEETTPVALYAAASSSARIALHTVNRTTGARVHRQYVDAKTGAPVAPADQVKGYEIAKDEFVTLQPDEAAAAIPHGDKTIEVAAFVDRGDIDELYFDRPYFLGPAERSAAEAFALLREGLKATSVAAIARALLFRRVRTLLIAPYDAGLIAMTLKFDYEVRSGAAAFAKIPPTKTSREALDLAKHIINTKRGDFDPSEFHDRYEAALAELVRAKVAGKPIRAARAAPPAAPGNLLAALRESARAVANAGRRRPPRATAPARKKAS